MRSRINIGIIVFSVGLFTTVFLCTRWSSHVICPVQVFKEPVYHVPLYLHGINKDKKEDDAVLQKKLRDERNKLSKELNEQRRKLGQHDCEVGVFSLKH